MKPSQARRIQLVSLALLAAILTLTVGVAPSGSSAASHREAPLISMDPEADITDFFMFRSYEAGQDDKIVLIMDVIPGEEPSSGPNYYNFDPSVLYAFHIDNDRDQSADDIHYEFQFTTEVRGVVQDLDLFLSYLGNVPPADGSIVPPITALDGPGSEGLGLRQKYTVWEVRKGKRARLAEGLIAVPSNVGPRTMPDYEALAAQGVYTLDNGIKVFAGQRDDPFYIDLGAVFDTLNLRSPGVDMLSGFNVHTIAMEIPARMLTKDGKDPDETNQPFLGAYANTSRRKVKVLEDPDLGLRDKEDDGPWVQVQRLANPLVNEAIIGTEDKDRWNARSPSAEAQFKEYYLNPRLALALELVFGADAPESGRQDLVDLLLKYPRKMDDDVAPAYGGDDDDDDRGNLAELLRLNVSVPPVPLNEQDPLTVLAGDSAGWPNGRRPIDDVTDIAIRVIGGENFSQAGDGVGANDLPLPDSFPFIPTPWSGFSRFHQNP